MECPSIQATRPPKTRPTGRLLYWHGTQGGRVALAERQLHVEKPRLRKRHAAAGEQAEVAVPAYEALRKDGKLADRMLAILLRCVSTDRPASSKKWHATKRQAQECLTYFIFARRFRWAQPTLLDLPVPVSISTEKFMPCDKSSTRG